MENALRPGSQILNGRYCLTRLLYQRPRVNLYLGQRLRMARQDTLVSASEVRGREDESLVAIRELLLSGLPSEAQTQIGRAAREEFDVPGVVSSLRLPGTRERMWLHSERERNYLILQLHGGNEHRSPSTISTLADLLQQPRWPHWLDAQTALAWGIQLCRIVARLHRLGTLLGDLDPATILIDQRGLAPWSPLLLVFWPPSPQFWREVGEGEQRAEDEGARRAENERERAEAAFIIPRMRLAHAPTNHANAVRHFPMAFPMLESAFVAPELIGGGCDERADVYALGAILYLLLTGYAPASALRRLASKYNLDGNDLNGREHVGAQFIAPVERGGGANSAWSLELIPPRLLRSQISSTLEDILLHSLALDPAERYASVFSLIEALEAVQEHQEFGGARRKAFHRALFAKK